MSRLRFAFHGPPPMHHFPASLRPLRSQSAFFRNTHYVELLQGLATSRTDDIISLLRALRSLGSV